MILSQLTVRSFCLNFSTEISERSRLNIKPPFVSFSSLPQRILENDPKYPFYNSCFKFGCGDRVDENVIYSCCSILSNACLFIYDWHHAMARHNNITKILYFFILFESRKFILKSLVICVTIWWPICQI